MLTGRILQQPASARWQLAGRKQITLSWTVDVGRIEEIETTLSAAEERGYHHFNVKVGRDPAFDAGICRVIRRLAPDAFIWVDANGGSYLAAAFIGCVRAEKIMLIPIGNAFGRDTSVLIDGCSICVRQCFGKHSDDG